MGSKYWEAHWHRRHSRRGMLALSGQVVAGAAALSVVGCGGDSDDDDDEGGLQPGSPTEATKETPRSGGTVRLLAGEPNTGFDPHLTQDVRTGTMLSLTHNFLVRRKQGPEFVPTSLTLEGDTAQGLPEQPDDLTYTFKLRPNVAWHDKAPLNGRAATAEDWKYSLERAVSSLSLFKGIIPFESITAPDATTLTLKTRVPHPELLFQLGLGQKFWLLAPEIEKELGDFKNPKSVIGTGPFMLDSFTASSVYKFVKNPKYFESGMPYLDGVQFDISDDPARALSLFLAKQTDFYPAVKRDDVPVVKRSRPDAVIDEYLGSRGDQLIFRCDRPPFNDLRIRRALSMGLDREAWKTSLLGGIGETDFPVSYAMPEWRMDAAAIGDSRKWHAHNPTEAKALLDAAGFDYGQTLSLEMTTARYGAYYGTIGQLIASDLKKIGVNTKIVELESAAFASKMITGNNPDQLVWTAKSTIESVNYFLGSWYLPTGDLWYSKANDPALIKLIEEQSRTVDTGKRKQLVDQAQKLIMDQAFATWGVMGNNFDAISPNLKNFRYKQSEAWPAGMRSAWLSG
jgi:peptide/nickel transport system substrate-binding protein